MHNKFLSKITAVAMAAIMAMTCMPTGALAAEIVDDVNDEIVTEIDTEEEVLVDETVVEDASEDEEITAEENIEAVEEEIQEEATVETVEEEIITADAETGLSNFTMTVNGAPVTAYNNIVDAVGSITDSDEAVITLTGDITLPASTAIVLSNGTLTLNLNGHTLSGVDTQYSTYFQILDARHKEAIIYMPSNGSNPTTAVLNITGEGTIASRSYEACGGEVDAIFGEKGATVNHLGGKIVGCNGVRIEDGNGHFTASGTASYEVEGTAIFVNGQIQIDKVNIKCNPKNITFQAKEGNNIPISLFGIYLSPSNDADNYIKNATIKLDGSKFEDNTAGCLSLTGINSPANFTRDISKLVAEKIDIELISSNSIDTSFSVFDASNYASATIADVNISVASNAVSKSFFTGLVASGKDGSKYSIKNVKIELNNKALRNGYSMNCFKASPFAGYNYVCEYDIDNVNINVIDEGGSKVNYGTPYIMSAVGNIRNCTVNYSGKTSEVRGLCVDIGSPISTSIENTKIKLNGSSYAYGLYAGLNSVNESAKVVVGNNVEIDVRECNYAHAIEKYYGFTGLGLKPGYKWVDEKAAPITDLESVKYAKTAETSSTTYTITYVLDGGVNADTNKTKYKETESLEFADATKEGYEFLGWYTDKNFAEDSKITTTDGQSGNLTVYAKWAPYSYTIKFDANYPVGSTADEQSGSKEDIAAVVSASIPLHNTFACKGYVFNGWNTKADGTGKAYKDHEMVTNLTLEKDGVVTLYATWKAAEYTVSSLAGNYTIGATKNPTGTKLNIKGTYGATTEFYVKAKAGYILDGVTYKVGDADAETLVADETDTTGNKYIIPAKTITANTVITVSVLKVEDLSKAVITPTFESLEYSGEAITAKALTVKIGTTTLPVDAYDTKYFNNTNAGTAILRVSAKEGSKVYTGYKDYAFTITGINIADSKKVIINVGKSVKWNGVGTTTFPSIQILDKESEEPLKASDYLIFTSNDDKPGKAKLTIIGRNGYYGSKDYTYTIEKPSFNEATATAEDYKICVPEVSETFVYFGTQYKPTFDVKYNGAELTEGIDYTIKYARNINAGTATATISGKGSYAGKIVKEFTINPVQFSVLGDRLKVTVPGNKSKSALPAPIVELRNPDGTIKTLKAGVDYRKITQSEFGSLVNIEGIGNYTGTIVRSYTTADKNLLDKSITISIPKESEKVVYAGEPVVPTVSVTTKDADGNIIDLNDGCDEDNKNYEVLYYNNDKVGKASIKVIGIGEYYGTKVINFNILARKVSEKVGETDVLERLDIKLDGNDAPNTDTDVAYDYTGYAIKPEVKIVDKALSENELVLNKDYTVSYSANTNVGKATATIKFKGNYSGSIKRTFTINSWDINFASVSAESVPYNNGKPVKPIVEVEINGAPVNPKVIKLTCENNKNVGEAKVKVEGVKATFITKSLELPYFVEKASLEDAIVADIKPQMLKGLPLEPKVTVTYNKVKLVQGRDYDVRYLLNNIKGEAEVFILATENGNFVGEIEKTFIIK